MHTPVLLHEAMEGLNIKSDGVYIDATVGEGGHIEEIAKRGGQVLGIDLDINQIQNLKSKVKNFENIKLMQGSFAEIEKIAKENGFYPVDGILFDLGLSMFQIENSGRGFSFKKGDEPLDMRLDPKLTTTAEEIVNTSDETKIYDLFARYSEDRHSAAIAHAIIGQRRLKPITRVRELKTVIDQVVGQEDRRTYARIFQALRIAVNDELENIKKGLGGALALLKTKGRLVVITFHSLEDRIVKQFIAKNGLRQINKKVTAANTKSSFERSAKLRIIEK